MYKERLFRRRTAGPGDRPARTTEETPVADAEKNVKGGLQGRKTDNKDPQRLKNPQDHLFEIFPVILAKARIFRINSLGTDASPLFICYNKK